MKFFSVRTPSFGTSFFDGTAGFRDFSFSRFACASSFVSVDCCGNVVFSCFSKNFPEMVTLHWHIQMFDDQLCLYSMILEHVV